MLNKSLQLSNLGFRVFPLAPGTKVPVKGFTEWQIKATTDRSQIQTWWSHWPNANIGIAPGSDYVVFDLDSKDGGEKALMHSLRILSDLGLPATYTIRTPSGGYHMYFLYTSGRPVKSTVGKAWGFPRVDIRAIGGYVVAAGSFTKATDKPKVYEGYYETIDSCDPVELPQGIKNLLPYSDSFLKKLQKSATDAATMSVTSALPEVIVVGERDSAMYSYIGRLISQGLSKDDIITKTHEAWKRCEQPIGNEFMWETVFAQIERSLELYRTDSYTPLGMPDEVVPEVVTLDAALERYCLIANGSFIADLAKDRRAEPLKWGDFKLSNSNLMVTVGDDAVRPLPDAWIAHSRRKRVHGITYYPKDIAILHIDNIAYFNRYVPSAIAPLTSYDRNKIAIARSHISYLLGDITDDMCIIERWMAYTIKRPEMKIPWAPLIITTEQGTGKGWLKDLLKIMVGSSNFGLATPEMLSPNQIQFNAWIGGTLLVLDELKGVDAKLLNHVVTETFGTVNPKYRPKETRNFFCNVIGFSNDLNALKISLKDRRWWIHDNIVIPKSQEYYTSLYSWLETDGVLHYYTYLHGIDTSSNSFMARPPMTQAKLRMIDDTTDQYLQCIQDAYALQQGPFEYDIVSTDVVMRYVKDEVDSDKSVSESYLGRYINTNLRKCLLPKSAQKYTMTIGAKRYRKRLICIRDPAKWSVAADVDVIDHYKQHWKGVGI